MKILITAGPTWVRIDEVRILTNIFSGRTGLFLAQGFRRYKHDVTLLINPHAVGRLPANLRVLTFRYFDELERALRRLLKSEQFDMIIHAAAVSDYQLKRPLKGKTPSGKRELVLRFRPTKKLISLIRRYAPNAILVQFKLESKRSTLIEASFKSLKRNRSDFVVANAYEDLKQGYRACIIDRTKRIVEVASKHSLFARLRHLASASD